ncbi:cell division protein ZipA [Thalassotalea sp. 1_MG-2023]|uniref:cell division protein ZipA n=1 Tax=Thalassotalea sp. 1_MG-2023 TaxID=3062680 RepID=UPI0026E41FC0|nr:cell division protein ZipA [Thalassotalea sp. 1_MG-2023]MDO6427726.1 cell division protein ZipA [Thalassotalea sp. 1_MG-2023]
MEDNFRNVLIIISAIVIAAIFVHGFWTIRKNKNPYKLKAKPESVAPTEHSFDSQGFDQDGIGKVRVVNESTLSEEEVPTAPAPAPDYDEDPIPKDVDKPNANSPSLEPSLGDLSDITEQPPLTSPPPQANASETQPEVEEEIITATEPVYQEPVSRRKPKRSNEKAAKGKVKRDQMEINFGDEFDEKASSAKSEKAPIREQKPDIDPEVIVVSVVMPEDNHISGAALLPTLLTLGLRFGEMDIFHRHEDNAGNGKVTFSLANMMNPGTFDLDNMESFTTQGITLFMTLPNAGDPFEVFEHLMNAAKHLAVEFNAQLLDDKRSVMTKQTEQHYMSKIREFERKHRIASA